MTATDPPAQPQFAAAGWLTAIRSYLLFAVPAHLLWEIAHLPLYTIWQEPLGRRAFAVFHCTLGDALIATATLVIATVLFGNGAWPSDRRSFRRVAVATIAIAVGYTVFSEWLNISVRRGWAYSPLMPQLPWIGTGLSPLFQWMVIPSVAFLFARRAATRMASAGARASSA